MRSRAFDRLRVPPPPPPPSPRRVACTTMAYDAEEMVSVVGSAAATGSLGAHSTHPNAATAGAVGGSSPRRAVRTMVRGGAASASMTQVSG